MKLYKLYLLNAFFLYAYLQIFIILEWWIIQCVIQNLCKLFTFNLSPSDYVQVQISNIITVILGKKKITVIKQRLTGKEGTL